MMIKAETVPPSAEGAAAQKIHVHNSNGTMGASNGGNNLQKNGGLMRSFEPNSGALVGGGPVYSTTSASSKLHLTPQINKSQLVTDREQRGGA